MCNKFVKFFLKSPPNPKIPEITDAKDCSLLLTSLAITPSSHAHRGLLIMIPQFQVTSS